MNRSKTELSEISFSKKINQNEILPKFKIFAYFFLSFAFSQVNAFGEFSPFAAAFLSICPINYLVYALVGATIGYIRLFSTAVAFKFIGCILLVCVCKLILSKFAKETNDATTDSMIAFSASLSSGIIYLLCTEFSFIFFMLALAQALTALVFSLVFSQVQNININQIDFSEMQPTDMINLFICSCCFLMCFSGFSLQGFSPARVLGFLLILFFANYKGLALASIVGICVGFSFSIDLDYSYLIACCTIGAVLSSLISPIGMIFSCASFAITNLAITMVIGFDKIAFITLIESCLACLIFVLTPENFWLQAQMFLTRNGLKPNDNINRKVSANLNKAANSVEDVSKIMRNVSRKLDDIIDPEVNKVFVKIQQNVCGECVRKNECWSKNFKATSDDILTMSGVIGDDDSKTFLQKSCIRSSDLMSQIELCRHEHMLSFSQKERLREMRGILTDQFSSISQFLREISQQVANERLVDNNRSRSLKNLFAENGVYVDSVKVFSNPNTSLSVEVTMIDNGFELDTNNLQKLIEQNLRVKFNKAEVAILELRTTISFDEKEYFRVQVGQSQLPCKDKDVCGDCIARVVSENGHDISIVSDGMGTGARAAIDASVTATLMQKLISSGFSFESCLKMVNSALIIKSTDESMATIDAIDINKFTGESEFYKAGATMSFVRHEKEVSVIEQSSLAVGIIREVKFATSKINLDQGDIVLLVSDGVVVGDYAWIDDELLAWSTNNMHELASHIAHLAKIKAEKNSEDDISVVAIKILRARELKE